MSTVTLSKPHCAITSAEKPDGIASHAFTTALPEAHTFLTLLVVIDRFPFVIVAISWSSRSLLAGGPLDAGLADADFAGSVDNRRPGIVRQWHAVFGALGARLPFGIAGHQHALDAGDRLGLPDEVGIARDFLVEVAAGVDHLGVDIESEHPVGELPAT